MCFGALTSVETCPVCGRHHPGGPVERCTDLRVEVESEGLEQELDRYLASREAAFFTWLAQRPA